MNGCVSYRKTLTVPNSKRKCKHKPCGKYSPVETIYGHANRWFCNEVCAGLWQLDQNRDKREKAAKKRHKEKLKQVRRNPRAEALLVAQKLARISRADDDGYVKCVTCGHIGLWNVGFDGGHWIPKGTSTYWMLEPDNIWPQCKPCNGNGMKYHGAESKFTLFMVGKFGAEKVKQMLDDSKKIAKRTTQDFDEFIAKAKAEIRDHEKRISGRS